MYSTPAKTTTIETTVRKSRFIARASAASTREQALAAVEESRRHWPDAGHHCWAYLIGSPASPATVAMSDDGEPSGTAGKPILNVLQHKDIGNIIVVVSRYFGGIKLGAGGLVRAYSGAAQSVIDVVPVVKFIPVIAQQLRISFSQEQDLRHWCSVNQAKIIDVEYLEHVHCIVELPEKFVENLTDTALERGWQLLDHD